jgi:hypothetical protein
MNNIIKETYEFILTAFVLGGIVGYFLQPSKELKETVCKNEIEEAKLLTMQLNATRLEFAQKKQEIIVDCEQNAREEALQKIEAYKAVCEQLRCEICKKAGK